ncbi:2-C-methyl-D-erythritol 4-phosphate cytidylyltransferase [Halalkalibacter sp. APA_J-10(15)]|uniref:2-C-methyl-D-erythritol 4-phosphate cytidylyltransferase n=1 Tax=unclassified Halalkalibacter TaxID=2893063 RepID=UPI001FF60295|nr:2-C-methyl-D-erythritol 4-phosphate cytidylyltransferase [Halalkalibacter sp. APA_J-10(15)]MCK0473296.1 2-C-methyl-D-erythritol 4-phosphate cytidylyltransferase [Halalkalibacter sp. APA_J-10(15)]
MKYSVVIVAAGQGKRMKAGKNKMLLELRGEPLVIHTLRLFVHDDQCDEVVLVVNEHEIEAMKKLVGVVEMNKPCKIVAGGKERQHSVKNGIDQLRHKGIVLVHDGARPFVRNDVLQKLVAQAKQSGAATTAVAVKDTVKRVQHHRVVETLNRSELWAVQTPQAFEVVLLQKAHEKAEEEGFFGTDDCSLIEWLGHEVVIVESDYHNIKLTTPEDLLFAEAILQERERHL